MPFSAPEHPIDDAFLAVRHQLIEIAAALDRMDRAATNGPSLRRQQIEEAIAVLAANEPGRAAAIQMVFSQRYDEDWRQRMNLGGAKS